MAGFHSSVRGALRLRTSGLIRNPAIIFMMAAALMFAPAGHAAAAAAAAADLDVRLAQAANAIDRVLTAADIPGMVIGITDRERLRKTIVFGYADVKTRTPLTAQSRFAIGSVSKAFTSIALLQLAQEGRFDPKAPVTRYLPSLTIRSQFRPITSRDLMSHTAGLPNYLTDASSSRYAAVKLHDFEAAYAPGTHWWYSNTGYQLLGYVLENIDKGTYLGIIERRVLSPLGMSSTSGVIDDAERKTMAVSYVRWPYDGRFVEAPWFEYAAGDGSVVSNVADMSAYLRFYLNQGSGKNGPVLTRQSFTALTTPVLDDYACGMFAKNENGDTVISHTGGIAGFVSDVEAHMKAGFGLVLLNNGGLDLQLMKWISDVVTAAYTGKALPDAPSKAGPLDLQRYVGSYRDPHAPPGEEGGLDFGTDGRQLFLKRGARRAALIKMGADTFREAGDAGNRLPFFFDRPSEPKDARAVGVSRGAQWYAASGASTRIAPALPKEYGSYIGHFENNGPEGPNARVFVRNGRLMLAHHLEAPAQPLEPLTPGVFRWGDKAYSPERVRFDTVVEGRALRLSISGVPLYRKDTP